MQCVDGNFTEPPKLLIVWHPFRSFVNQLMAGIGHSEVHAICWREDALKRNRCFIHRVCVCVCVFVCVKVSQIERI